MKYKKRIILAIICVISIGVFNTFYNTSEGIIEGHAAVLQVENDNISYLIGQKASEGATQDYVNLFGCTLIVFIGISIAYSELVK